MIVHRAAFLLDLIAADNHKPIVGRTKLQKLMFLIQNQVLGDTLYKKDHYIFEPYKFGPFSVEILDDIELLIDLKLIKKSDEDENEIFEITEIGQEKLKTIRSNIPQKILDQIEEIKKQYGKLPIQKLLTYVYQRYPEYTINSEIRDKIVY